MYSGPNPKEINENFPDHSYSHITCLVTGKSVRMLREDRLNKVGYTKEKYLRDFPGAPTMSLAAKETRSNNLTKLNESGTESQFNKNRLKGRIDFLNSEESSAYRKNLSDKTKLQHKETNLEDHIRNYFLTSYIDSEDQNNRSERMKHFNNNQSQDIKDKRVENFLKTINSDFSRLRKKEYKNTNLFYQSSYELNFLQKCEELHILNFVSNCKSMKDEIYPKRYYLPDFKLFDTYVVEIKSSYVEKYQEEKQGLFLEDKKNLVIRSGYKWLYVLDNNFTELEHIVKNY